ILDCGDDMSSMSFILDKYKYFIKVDEDFNFEFYTKDIEGGVDFSKRDAVKTLSFLSIFEYFGIYSEFSNNLDLLSQKVLKLEKKKVNSIINFFIEKKIIKNQGDFIKLEDY